MIYLDYAATSPMSDQSLQAYTEVATKYYGNSSSSHDIGTTANQLLEAARAKIARLLNGAKDGVYFTSGGSEGNFYAITSLVHAHKHKGKHLITTKTEHTSVYNTFRKLELNGFDVTFLDVNEYGEVDPGRLEKEIREDTILVSIAHVNHEIGTIQPIKEIVEILSKRNILFHSDCVQSFTKTHLDIENYHLSSITVSSHKVYGPKGVGACYIDPKVNWKPMIDGTTHEKGFRPGTVDVPGITAFTIAAEESMKSLARDMKKYQSLKKLFLQEVSTYNGIHIEGNYRSIPQIIGFRVKGFEGQHVMLQYNRNNIAVSTGSACSVGQQSPSKTLLAIGRTPDESRELVRISFGRQTLKYEILQAVNVLKNVLNET
ncbi:IscS subfamily cysteine desulfurase [Salirhabdus salicampi]|uniref:IscS subfamily cysteine desulfurase n=1 Tax=Salirhabdus salicampi TaxID=476102 RepID=UPI0020C46B0F|nr:IscS subfamily cysteine desulfurase [Salirhabdus salicampi]MCP8615969.1 IscS subfamily cysteine desulfurase [Salirhabdus salicampi]